MSIAAPPIRKRATPIEWVKDNLFYNWWSGVITVVMFPILAYLLYRAFRFVFITGQWLAVTQNLTLFMQGTFPREAQWRLISQLLIFALAFGVGAGTSSASTRDSAADAGLPIPHTSIADTAKRMWSLILFIAVLLAAATVNPTGTLLNPFLLVIGVGLATFIGYQAKRIPRRFRNVGWLATAVLSLFGFQVVSGFDAGGWVSLTLIFTVAIWMGLPVERFGSPSVRALVKLAAIVVVGLILRFVYGAIDGTGIGWDKWSGLQLTLMVSAIAIVLAFPLGLLLALARRSTLPALRWMATGYIEVIRGVPLITLLFFGQFVLAFLLPEGSTLSNITRAIVAMSLFTAAYVAEIVRGGLQSLPKGQTEAGQALGMAPPSIMQRIVLPQALRAVIPAMVGQFISLFKDSSLLTIIGILEFLGVREIVHAQPEFRGVAVAETLVFIAFGYWAFAFAMSRESQRLERRLRVSR